MYTGDTLEEAMATAVAALGTDLQVRRARKVRQGMRGLMGREVYEVLAAPGPSRAAARAASGGDAVGSALDRLLADADADDSAPPPAAPRSGRGTDAPRSGSGAPVPGGAGPSPAPARPTARGTASSPAAASGTPSGSTVSGGTVSGATVSGTTVSGPAGGAPPSRASAAPSAAPAAADDLAGPAAHRSTRSTAAEPEPPAAPRGTSRAAEPAPAPAPPRTRATRTAAAPVSAAPTAPSARRTPPPAPARGRAARDRVVEGEVLPAASRAAPARPRPAAGRAEGPVAHPDPAVAEHSSLAPARGQAPGWDRRALRRMGVPAPVLAALPEDDPADDLGWLTALTAAITACVPAPATLGPEHPVVVDGHGLEGVIGVLQACVKGATPGTLALGGRTAPATAVELALVLRTHVTGG